VGAFLEVFGVAGEGDAGVVDDTLVHGRRHQGVELSGKRALDSAVEQREHVACVGGIGPARDARRGERQVRDGELAGRVDGGARCA